jgi:TetR/AcrR family transcriptional regulator
MTESRPSSRRQQILEALARDLEQRPGYRITTARLAEVVGVSEAALYRHFPSKAKMFDGLIEFIEDTIFSRISIILADQTNTESKCKNTLHLLLTFTERNPGITRILTGDPLAGESDRLRIRVAQFFDRFETQLRQMLRESELRGGSVPRIETTIAANLMLAAAEGRICQFVRSDFTRRPTEHWDEQWKAVRHAVF